MISWSVNAALANHTQFSLHNDGHSAMGVESRICYDPRTYKHLRACNPLSKCHMGLPEAHGNRFKKIKKTLVVLLHTSFNTTRLRHDSVIMIQWYSIRKKTLVCFAGKKSNVANVTNRRRPRTVSGQHWPVSPVALSRSENESSPTSLMSFQP